MGPPLCPQTLPSGIRRGRGVLPGVEGRGGQSCGPRPSGRSSCGRRGPGRPAALTVVGNTVWLRRCGLSERFCHSSWGRAVVVGSPPSAPAPCTVSSVSSVASAGGPWRPRWPLWFLVARWAAGPGGAGIAVLGGVRCQGSAWPLPHPEKAASAWAGDGRPPRHHQTQGGTSLRP